MCSLGAMNHYTLSQKYIFADEAKQIYSNVDIKQKFVKVVGEHTAEGIALLVSQMENRFPLKDGFVDGDCKRLLNEVKAQFVSKYPNGNVNEAQAFDFSGMIWAKYYGGEIDATAFYFSFKDYWQTHNSLVLTGREDVYYLVYSAIMQKRASNQKI